MDVKARRNVDDRTVAGFGDEWRRFDQSSLSDHEFEELFDRYFREFPWASLADDAVGFDMGCGSGRWARGVAPRVGRLICMDASLDALEVACRSLAGSANCAFVQASVGAVPIGDATMDFGYSLGVLHHVPDTAAAIRECARKLKPGAPLLLYIYYAFDNRPWWFRLIWRASDALRKIVSSLPMGPRYYATQPIALFVYWPLARLSKLLERLGFDVDAFPLSSYRHSSFYTMRTDALDRFGTRLEQRFTAPQIATMMRDAGLDGVRFSATVPYWCAVGFKV